MNTDIKKYDLHKNDYSKLHFELHDARSYFLKYKEKSTVPHRHSFYQIIWFKEAGNHYVDYEVVSHKSDAVFFINTNQVHHFCPESENEGILFHFDDFFIKKSGANLMDRFELTIFDELGDCFLAIEKDISHKVQLITSSISQELQGQKHAYQDQVFHLFQIILLEIERLKQSAAERSLQNQKDYLLIVNFKRLIASTLGDNLGIEEYAEKLNTNTKKLTTICKKYTKETPANFIKQRKVLEAKRILSNHKLSVKEIAYSLGFDQPTYFTKYFKRETGLTPKEFRQSIL